METFRHSMYKFLGKESPTSSSSSSTGSSSSAATGSAGVGKNRPQPRGVSVSLTDDATPTEISGSNGVGFQSSVMQGTLNHWLICRLAVLPAIMRVGDLTSTQTYK